MNTVWAPWRIEYITAPDKIEGCIFCNALSHDDSVHHVLVRRESCFALLNKYPYNNGHLMIAPNQHTGCMEHLAVEVMGEMMELVRDCKQILSAAMCPDGFNIGINIGRVAGAGILEHLHIHIVPRWNGDTNFMPVIGDTKVMPQALDGAYQALMKKKIELFGKN
ncbi:MAG: HIT domain-containing protein [Candidatus Auribacterota bacterium]